MRRTASVVLLACMTCVGCGKSGEVGTPVKVVMPSEIAVERTGTAEVKVTWKDNSNNETGFSVWVRAVADAFDVKLAGNVGAGEIEYTVSSGLAEGNSYYFGVQANATDKKYSSRISYIADPFKLIPESELPSASITGEIMSTATCIAVPYKISNNTVGDRYGLCWSAEGIPVTDDDVQYGPDLPDDGGAVLQVIPNALLDYGKSYKIRAFVETSAGTYYSAEKSVSLALAPAAITLTWTKLTESSLPADIELYETVSNLNGRKFHAWYAVADVKGDIELRVDNVSPAKNLDNQFADDCYVLVNAGYMYNGRHTGLVVVNGVTSPGTVYDVLTTGNDAGVRYCVTRGAFGVDVSGIPGVYWVGATSSPNVAYYYDRPMPTVVGEARYKTASSENPALAISWTPRNAISAGPVLLYDGKILFDFTLTSKETGNLLSNYEVIPNDIFGDSGVIPDRTAVGYLADGRIVLFVCDGRIIASQGANVLELAQIMKGLGCVGALNLDGGGSTGIVVGGRFLNDQEHGKRVIASTLGFYKKK